MMLLKATLSSKNPFSFLPYLSRHINSSRYDGKRSANHEISRICEVPVGALQMLPRPLHWRNVVKPRNARNGRVW